MNETSRSNEPSGITTPVAIIVAGALIAVALYAGMRSQSGVATNVGTGTGAQPAAPAASQAPPAQPTVGTFRDVSNDDHIQGSANAKITLLEYSDIECPFCRQFHPTVKRILEAYPNDVRWVYRHFPLEAIHPNARISAIATECADEQGKFWEMLDYLFENVTTGADLAEDKLPEHARAAGVPNIATFTTCLQNETHDDTVTADIADAQAAGGSGTPYTILIGPDGEKVPVSGAQPFEAVKAKVDELLAG